MVKNQKGFNWRARQVVSTIIDNSETKNISLEINTNQKYDDSNLLVLPSKKRTTKIRKEKVKITRILSKKHRKKLEKIVERKQKKENRAGLLEALSKVQATPEELDQLTSIASVQTKGLKRIHQEENAPKQIKNTNYISEVKPVSEVKIKSVSGRRPIYQLDSIKTTENNPNVVGFESSSSSETENSDLEDESETTQETKIDQEQEEEEIVEQISEAKKAKLEETIIENGDNGCEIIEDRSNKTINIKDDPPKTIIVEHKPAIFVDVLRTKEIQAARLKLPILAEEQQIMEIINESSVIIVCGETGSGKTTQVPQFLFEAGYALKKQIAVTEPRRVAAISMSKRVADEMNLSTSEVSYLIRFEGNTTDDTKIKFMTDGVLLKEVQTDFLLTKYSVVILDEAHERSVYTDILIGLLSRIVPMRNKRNDPLKLIIMSATLRLEDFTTNQRLFKTTPPIVNVDARQFPVTIHFNKRTNSDYLKEAFNKTVKIHTKLPEGGILIFLTGQQEVNSLVRKLRKAFPLKHHRYKKIKEEKKTTDDLIDDGLKKALKRKTEILIPEINLDDYSVPGDTENNSETELEDSDTEETAVVSCTQPLWVLPLYSLLPTHKQSKVFESAPAGCRLCIVSTNVAETSLTIPNVKYVVDSGKTKVKLYDKLTGVSSYVVTWTSKASADQRAGRAGRIGPGHCYRLYSSAVFNDTFQDFGAPEIQQKPVDDLYLQMKCMNIDKVINFPFPTAPDLIQLKTAEDRLTVLGALSGGKVTPMGKAIAKFPLLPRFGKMLALSHQQNLLPYTICLVAALSVQEVLLEVPILPSTPEETKNIRHKWMSTRLRWASTGNSSLLGDNMVLLKAVGAAEYANSQGDLEVFCDENGLRHKAIVEIRKLRLQLTSEVKTNVRDCDIVVDPKLAPPNDLQAKLLRQILLSGMGDQIAKKMSIDEVPPGENKAKFKYAYHANNMEDLVFLHQGSVLKKSLPEFVVYQEIYETNKIYMRGVTGIEPEWLPIYVPSLCNLSEPLNDPEPRYKDATGRVHCTVTGTFGTQAWELPTLEVEHPKNLDCFKWFGRFVLEGKVCKKLEKYETHLISRPTTILKSWAKLQPRINNFLRALMRNDVFHRNSLEEAWKSNPKFLLPEYLKWLPESAHSEVSLLWPPL